MTNATMLGEKMQVELSRHCIKRIRERTDYTAEDVLYRTIQLLERTDIAEYILLEIPIGDEIVILDKEAGYSIALVVEQNDIIIKTIFCYSDNHHLYVGEKQKCVVLSKVTQMVNGLASRNIA